ncbi:hypothetical protein QJS66_07715 [Kocuria rhizophila]|nr:hypothetical protein QJS66_07715 [Kocuria rhizophila]
MQFDRLVHGVHPLSAARPGPTGPRGHGRPRLGGPRRRAGRPPGTPCAGPGPAACPVESRRRTPTAAGARPLAGGGRPVDRAPAARGPARQTPQPLPAAAPRPVNPPLPGPTSQSRPPPLPSRRRPGCGPRRVRRVVAPAGARTPPSPWSPSPPP